MQQASRKAEPGDYKHAVNTVADPGGGKGDASASPF